MLEKKKRELHVRFGERDYNLLGELARRVGTTRSWLIRHCVSYYLEKKGCYHDSFSR